MGSRAKPELPSKRIDPSGDQATVPLMSRLTGVLLVTAALLAMPASASAATVFGADMSQDPAFDTSLYSITTVIDPGGTPNTGAPVSGILTSVRLKTSGAPGSGFIQVLTFTGQPDSTTYTFLNDPPQIPISVPADATPHGHVTEVLTRRPITAGQKLAVDLNDIASSIADAYNDPTAECAYFSQNDPGESHDYTTLSCNHNPPLISGTIEADADHDGFGDDSQDQCPTDAATQGPCPTTGPIPQPKKKCKKKHRSADAVVAKKCKKKHR